MLIKNLYVLEMSESISDKQENKKILVTSISSFLRKVSKSVLPLGRE